MCGGLMNFSSSFHKKAFGSFAAICLFSAATCAVITFSAAKQDGSYVSLKTNESSPFLAVSLFDGENKQNIKNNSSNTVISSNKIGENRFYQTNKSYAELAVQHAYMICSQSLNTFLYNRIGQLQDNGLISIRKIE